MNKKSVLLTTAIALTALTAVALNHFQKHQRLGTPAIKATPISGSVVMKIDLPEQVLDFGSINLEESAVVTNTLPKDTSYAQRIYTNAQSFFPIQANIILMGKDRTSIHKPEYCLQGQGILVTSKQNVSIVIAGEPPYDLTVAKWSLSKSVKDDAGRTVELHGFYVFWYAAESKETTDFWHLWGSLMWNMVTKGTLQRWSYISYFTWCVPGQEDATFERVSKLIAASVPEFQYPPRPENSTALAKQ
jgi:hypothetical protein